MEHNSMGVDSRTNRHGLSCGLITPIVRVPGKEHYHASRLLDAGAQGIVVPHVDTVEEAQRVVSHCKYPPIGHRSLGGPPPQLSYQPTPTGEATRIVNEETLVVVMLETPQAIDNADAIAQVPGLDVLLVGFNDPALKWVSLATSMPRWRRTSKSSRRARSGKPGHGRYLRSSTMQKYIGMGALHPERSTSRSEAGANARTSFLCGIKL
jgi:2-keto-3-deoxy-L-rhamnonate aldolase RhmA